MAKFILLNKVTMMTMKTTHGMETQRSKCDSSPVATDFLSKKSPEFRFAIMWNCKLSETERCTFICVCVIAMYNSTSYPTFYTGVEIKHWVRGCV